MIHLAPNVDPTNVLGFLRTCQKQITRAGIRTANNMAIKVQAFTTGTLLPDKFILRAKGTPWYKPGQKFGFNVKFANPELPQATIGSGADWLRLQEAGGEKDAANGKQLAIPSPFWRPPNQMMTAAKKPRAILGSEFVGPLPQSAGRKLKRARNAGAKQIAGSGLEGAFILRARDGTKLGIYAHKPGEKRAQILFRFQDDAKIKPVLEFEETGKKIVQDNFDRDFTAEFAVAMSTARQK